MKVNLGLFILRAGLGASMIAHGFPKLTNPAKWGPLGENMSYIGINFLPEFWGFMAGFTETFGGLFFVIGFLTRTTSAMLAFTMLIAMLTHVGRGDGFNGISHALELMIVFLAVIFTGPGDFALENFKKRSASRSDLL